LSEDRDTQGRFAEPAFGQSGIEREAGYVPMPDDPANRKEADELSTNEAAEDLAAGRETGVIIPREYLDGEGKPLVDEDGKPTKETISLERAAHDLTALRNAEADDAAKSISKDFAAEVDKIRGESAKDETKANQEETAKTELAKEAPKLDVAAEVDVDAEIAKALSHPKIAEVLSKHVGDAEQSRQQYVAGLDAATKIAQAAFIGQFPEFANIPTEQHAAVLAGLQQHNPARFNQVYAAVASTQNLFAQQAAEQQRQAQAKRAEFVEYAKAEDAKFADMMKGETPQALAVITGEIVEAVKEYGADAKQFFEAYANEPLLRNAIVQRMMVDAAKYRMIRKAPAKAMPKPVPQVQRPGVRGSGSASTGNSLSNLDARLSRTGNAKDAAALLIAKRNARKAS